MGWQLNPVCLRFVSRGDRSAALYTSWWWHSFSLGGRWLQCHHHVAPDVNCHLGANEPAKRQAHRYTGIQAVEQNQKRELQERCQHEDRKHLKQTFVFQASFIWMKLYRGSQGRPIQGELRSTLTVTWSIELVSSMTLRWFHSYQWDWNVSVC